MYTGKYTSGLKWREILKFKKITSRHLHCETTIDTSTTIVVYLIIIIITRQTETVQIIR